MSGHVSARRQGKTPYAWRRLPYDVSSITQADPFGQICQKAKIPEKGLKKSLKFARDSSSFRDQRLIPDTSGHLSRARGRPAPGQRGRPAIREPRTRRPSLRGSSQIQVTSFIHIAFLTCHALTRPACLAEGRRHCVHFTPDPTQGVLNSIHLLHIAVAARTNIKMGGGINTRAFFYFLTVFVFLFNFLTNI